VQRIELNMRDAQAPSYAAGDGGLPGAGNTGHVDAAELPHAQIALAWLLQNDAVTAPIVGATKMEHLETAVAALGVQLSKEEVTALEAPYVAHPIAGFS